MTLADEASDAMQENRFLHPGSLFFIAFFIGIFSIIGCDSEKELEDWRKT